MIFLVGLAVSRLSKLITMSLKMSIHYSFNILSYSFFARFRFPLSISDTYRLTEDPVPISNLAASQALLQRCLCFNALATATFQSSDFR